MGKQVVVAAALVGRWRLSIRDDMVGQSGKYYPVGGIFTLLRKDFLATFSMGELPRAGGGRSQLL